MMAQELADLIYADKELGLRMLVLHNLLDMKKSLS